MYAEKMSDLSPYKYPLRNTHFYMNFEKEGGSLISNYSTKDLSPTWNEIQNMWGKY